MRSFDKSAGAETLRLLLEVKRADNLAQAEAYRDRQTLLTQWASLLDLTLESGACFTLDFREDHP